MGNSQSAVSDRAYLSEERILEGSSMKPIALVPSDNVHLDFDNMPFLHPPQESDVDPHVIGNQLSPGSPLPPVPSPPLASANYKNFGKHTVVKNYTNPRFASEGHFDHTLNDYDFFGSSERLSSRPPAHEASSPPESPSIASQLSVLSERSSPRGSPSSSPRLHRRAFSDRSHGELIDAGVPPPVPPHMTFPDYVVSRLDPEAETILAAVDALEEDADLDLGRPPTRTRSRSRSRSQSLSRSLTRRKSLGSESVASIKSMTTDVYTRKCPSAVFKTAESPQSLTSDYSNDSDGSIQEPISPTDQGEISFSLEGYNEGTTKLRVVNFGANDDDDDGPYLQEIPQKFFVKSKAQLAEEEEQKSRAWAKRYERYGHIYRGRA